MNRNAATAKVRASNERRALRHTEARSEKSTGPILLVGSAETCPDLEYASGFRSPDPVVFLRAPDRDFLVVPPLEFGRAARGGKGIEVLTPDLLGLAPGQRRQPGEWAVSLLRREGVRRVHVPDTFPHGIALRLERAGVQVRVLQGDVFPERAVKTPEEVRRISVAQQAAVIAMRAAVDLIARTAIDASGYLKLRGSRLTTEQVKETILRILIDHRSLCREPIVAGGPAAADPHEPGRGPLRAHEAIVIDIFPQHLEYAYWGDLTRTVVRGTPSPVLKRMHHAVKAAQAAALGRVRAGVSGGTVHRAAADEFRRRGFETQLREGKPEGFIHGTGHGVGLCIHEAPSVSQNDSRLRAGHVITIEPGLYYPGIGGVRIEDTIVVTSTGWRYLAPCEKRFEV